MLPTEYLTFYFHPQVICKQACKLGTLYKFPLPIDKKPLLLINLI